MEVRPNRIASDREITFQFLQSASRFEQERYNILSYETELLPPGLITATKGSFFRLQCSCVDLRFRLRLGRLPMTEDEWEELTLVILEYFDGVTKIDALIAPEPI